MSEEGGVKPEELDYIAFYDKPLTKFDRLLETYLAYAPAGFQELSAGHAALAEGQTPPAPHPAPAVRAARRARLVFTDHHESHAASAFFPSPFERAAILTLDGVGEWSTATYGTGEGNKLRLLQQLRFPHSLGLLYSAFTYYCGFKVNSGEYKLMGLAPYGQPVYEDLILKHLLDLKPDGSFWMNMEYFNYCQGLTMTNDRFHQLFGGPPRNPESHARAAAHGPGGEHPEGDRGDHAAHGAGGASADQMKALVLAGGVALNCVANGRLLREGPFENIWIQPAAGDAGGALGAAALRVAPTAEQAAPDQRPGPAERQPARAALLQRLYRAIPRGDGCAAPAVRERKRPAASAWRNSWPKAKSWAGFRAGWSSARGRSGRAASSAMRAIPRMQATMNLKIKFRESFRPFAPCVLQERVSDYFEMRPEQESPYMLLVAPVLEQHRWRFRNRTGRRWPRPPTCASA